MMTAQDQAMVTFAHAYQQVLENFLCSLGVTEANAEEYALYRRRGSEHDVDVLHHGIHVGSVFVRRRSMKFVIECKMTADGCPEPQVT